MIVSPEHRFIFVHIFKTAGTSIKRAIRRYAMPKWQEPANVILKRIGIPQFGPVRLPDHMTASEMIGHIGQDEYKKYFSFAFVRNPWDWELSHFKYILDKPKHPQHAEVAVMRDFAEYLDWRCDGRYRLQQDFLTHDGRQVVDFVGRFESLQRDFTFVCDTLGIDYRLPKLNTTKQTDYAEHYTPRMVELVRDTYREDIELFEYEFGA